MRIFIAVNIPDKVKEEISYLRDDLKRALSDVRWVEKDKFHITLKFIGEVEQGDIPAITGLVSEKLSGFGEFKISFFGAGMFPDMKTPKIVWAGIKDGADRLQKLAKLLEDEMFLLGYAKEKREFAPHLTLGRIRSQKNSQAVIKRVKNNMDKNIGSCLIKSVDIMQSILLPQGVEYKCLKSVLI